MPEASKKLTPMTLNSMVYEAFQNRLRLAKTAEQQQELYALFNVVRDSVNQALEVGGPISSDCIDGLWSEIENRSYLGFARHNAFGLSTLTHMDAADYKFFRYQFEFIKFAISMGPRILSLTPIEPMDEVIHKPTAFRLRLDEIVTKKRIEMQDPANPFFPPQDAKRSDSIVFQFLRELEEASSQSSMTSLNDWFDGPLGQLRHSLTPDFVGKLSDEDRQSIRRHLTHLHTLLADESSRLHRLRSAQEGSSAADPDSEEGRIDQLIQDINAVIALVS